MINKIVMTMAMLRLMSGSIELLVAVLMLRWNQIEKAVMLNSGLALVGPTVLVATTTIGLVGIADKLSISKFIWVAVGVCCLFIGIMKK